jgi:hypothetical protein
MKGAKMTTEQIIKATKVLEGAKVMVANRDFNEFQDAIITAINALALIKELLAENTGLKTALETMKGVVKDYEHHNENLLKENKYLRERLAEEMEHKEDMKGK